MKVKTKTVNLISSIGILLTSITLLGCNKVTLPQPPVPGLFAETETARPVQSVVKHISLFKQGVGFDILDNDESRDATGVVISKNNVKVMNDIMTIEKKSKKESVDKFLDNINQLAGNCYTIEKQNGTSSYEIYIAKINSSCDRKGKDEASQVVYIYNQDTPETMIKIEQADKNNSPRADLEQTKVRYESIQFL